MQKDDFILALVKRIEKELMTIEQVPEIYQEAVQTSLDQRG